MNKCNICEKDGFADSDGEFVPFLGLACFICASCFEIASAGGALEEPPDPESAAPCDPYADFRMDAADVLSPLQVEEGK